MPNPLKGSVDLVKSDAPNLPAGTTIDTSFPSDGSLSHPHIQVAWDGSQSWADNREDATTRVTVWTPKGQVNLGIDIAEGMIARLVNGGSASIQQIGRGAGRLADVDRATGLPFCSFTILPVFLAPAP